MAIQIRRGSYVDFDSTKLLPGELAVSVDNETGKQVVWMCFRAGVTKRMGTYEDFRAQIAEATDDIREEYKRVFDEIREYMESLAEESEENKNVSAEKAGESAASSENASEKASEALMSASTASAKATEAKNYAKQAQSYAIGTGGVRLNESTDSAKHYYEQVKSISEKLSGTLHPKGTVAFTNLPALTETEEGWMYNISNQFVTDTNFKEGAGHIIPAGSNVYKTADGFWDILAGTPVSSINGQTGNVNITPNNIGIGKGTCNTAQGTAAKIVDCPDFQLYDGARIMITFANGNTSNYMTLNVNNTGGVTAYFPIGGGRAYNNDAIAKIITAGCAYEFIYQTGNPNKWVYCGATGFNLTPEDINAASYDTSAFQSGEAILSWANSMAGNASKGIVQPNYPEDAPVKAEGTVELIVLAGGRKNVRFTGYLQKGYYVRGIFNGNWYDEWKNISGAVSTSQVINGEITSGITSDNLASYGISKGNTVEEICGLLPHNSITYINSNVQSNVFANSLPTAKGCVVLYIDDGGGRGWAEFHQYDSSMVYFARLHDSKMSGWSTNYLPLGGGILSGDVALPIAVSSRDNSLPVAGSGMGNLTDIKNLKNYKTYLGAFQYNGKWQNLISTRHRNGFGDGNNYGMYIRSPLTEEGDLKWGKQYGANSWQEERTILDSKNFSDYALTKNGNAASATKATQDGNGNNIANTYAKKSIYDDNAVSMGRKSGTEIGDNSIAVGVYAEASGIYSFSYGHSTKATGDQSHAEGQFTEATGKNSHAEGHSTKATGENSHAEGGSAKALAKNSHAEGYITEANGNYSHAEGQQSKAEGECSHAEGYVTTASNYASHAIGKFNKEMTTGGGAYDQIGDVFVIGNGISTSKSNALRVTYTGDVLGTKAFQSSGADYAEFIEQWADGNEQNEDRIGYFVTVKKGLLYKANAGDYIAGITSGNPSVVGNADEDYYWRYARDEFNRIIMEDVPETIQKTEKKLITQIVRQIDEDGNGELIYEEIPLLDENGNEQYEDVPMFDKDTSEPIMVETGNIIKNARMKLADDYDPSLQDTYIPRAERKEWDYVGMVGVLPVRDDGTCKPNHFCKCGQDGIATFAVERGFDTFYVIERISDNIVSVILR